MSAPARSDAALTASVTDGAATETASASASAPGSAGSASAGIEVSGVSKHFGGPPVLSDVSLDVRPGTMVALLGPSGCGKTTLLRIIAGLEVPDAGTVAIGDRILTAPGSFVPPEKRRVGMVFQDWALFPHMSVGKNVGYGLDREARRGDRVERALAMVGLEGLGDRLPTTLSGGQQQRVALARAIAPEPSALLLDEPFSNLDSSLRVQVHSEVHELLVSLGITTVFVTHDQEEAFVLGDDVAVMHEGLVVQQASPAEIYATPASPWVADFVGDANLVPGVASGESADTALGRVPLATGTPGSAPSGSPLAGDVSVLLRPEHVALSPAAGASGSAEPAEVELVEFYGHDTVYVVRLHDGCRLRARAGATPRFARGDRVEVTYAGEPTVAYPAGT